MHANPVQQNVVLRAYYVQGVDARHDVAIKHATIRVLVEVSTIGQDRITSTKTKTMWVRLYDDEGIAIVSTHCPSGYFTAHSLLEKNGKYVQSGISQTISNYVLENSIDHRLIGIVGQSNRPSQ